MKIASFSALGAVIGFLVAFAFVPAWWAGTLGVAAGSIVGYVFVDPSAFFAATASAWRETTKRRPRDHELERLRWAAFGWVTLGVWTIFSNLVLAMSAFYYGMEMLTPLKESGWEILVALLLVVFGVGVPVCSFLVTSMNMSSREFKIGGLQNAIDQGKEAARKGNPVAVSIFLLKKLGALGWSFLEHVVKAPGAMKRFAVLTVQKTLSNARLCGLLGAALGAAVGFFCFMQTKSPGAGVVIAGGVGFLAGLALSHIHQRVRVRA